MNFSQMLCMLLEKNNTSNYTLAKGIGVSQSTVANWLNEKSTPNFTKLKKIADFFDVSVDYLLGKATEPDKTGNTELEEYLEELRTRPEMKMLFNLTKNATKEDVEKAVKIIETMLGK